MKLAFGDREARSSIVGLDARIILGECLVRRSVNISIPVGALGLGDSPVCGIDGVEALVLHELHCQALGGVPSDVAVYEPCSGVVKLEGNSEVAVAGEGRDVTARGVHQVE